MAPAVMDETETTTEVETMSELNLGDIPDLSGMEEEPSTEWADGWYEGTILEARRFTDSNGNDRVFESNDAPSASGNGRNIRLQVAIKRQSDGRTMNLSTLVNYRPEDLTTETIQAITAHQAKMKETGEQWGPLFRAFATLQRLGQLQRIAGVRQLQRSAEGGLNLAPLYGKKGYFRLVPDDRNPAFKAVKTFQAEAPKRAKVN